MVDKKSSEKRDLNGVTSKNEIVNAKERKCVESDTEEDAIYSTW